MTSEIVAVVVEHDDEQVNHHHQQYVIVEETSELVLELIEQHVIAFLEIYSLNLVVVVLIDHIELVMPFVQL